MQSSKSLSTLLREQYSATEDYCNAQTSFRNAVVSRQDSSNSGQSPMRLNRYVVLNQALMHHQTALDRIQENLQHLHEHHNALSESYETPDSGSALLQKVLSQHLQRTERVLRTIYIEGGGVYHPNGLPVPTGEGESENAASALMVALSTLRASMHLVQGHLPQIDGEG